MMDNNRMIRIYGTLRNWTVNKDIADFNPTRQGCIRVRTSEKDGSGHDDAIALAYQLYDNRFRECDKSLKPWERFQDMINKRVTNIKFVSSAHCHEWADKDAYTEIDGPIAIQYSDEDGNVDPENWENGSDTKPVILQEILKWFKVKIENIENILNNFDLTEILNRITVLERRKVVTKVEVEYAVGGPGQILRVEYSDGSHNEYDITGPIEIGPTTGDCLWEEWSSDAGAGVRPKNGRVVYGPGFYDTAVQ